MAQKAFQHLDLPTAAGSQEGVSPTPAGKSQTHCCLSHGYLLISHPRTELVKLSSRQSSDLNSYTGSSERPFQPGAKQPFSRIPPGQHQVALCVFFIELNHCLLVSHLLHICITNSVPHLNVHSTRRETSPILFTSPQNSLCHTGILKYLLIKRAFAETLGIVQFLKYEKSGSVCTSMFFCI